MDIDGLSLREALDLTDAELDALVFVGRPILFSIGSAKILGEFQRDSRRLTIELAQIEGGGEGVLAMLARLVAALAERSDVHEVLWLVHAVTCIEPNLKLQRVLHARGFEVREVDGSGEVYCRLDRRRSPGRPTFCTWRVRTPSLTQTNLVTGGPADTLSVRSLSRSLAKCAGRAPLD